MSKKTTRGSKPKADPDAETKAQRSVATSTKKVLFLSQKLLPTEKDGPKLQLERFFHPGSGKDALFVTHQSGQQLMELLEFAEPRRSWLLNNEVCSNGRIYMSTPLDATILALHHIRKHCSQRAMSLDNLAAEEPNNSRLLTEFLDPEALKCVADVKKSGDMLFYKFNQERALAFLALKTRRVAEVLKGKRIHCGHSAQSQNFVRSEKLSADDAGTNEADYLRMACDIVGRYLDSDLHDLLTGYLHIPSEIQAIVEEKAAAQKRKSKAGQEGGGETKKIKLSDSSAGEKLRSSGLIDSDTDNNTSITSPMAAPALKERSLTAKEKALAKGAKGTKSIASFFKVK
ncbi:hypothetical protein KR018_000681 [Drosophila ironensis]|nr:hypothetical protein KR018_000681 [Drosophila ironensis]